MTPYSARTQSRAMDLGSTGSIVGWNETFARRRASLSSSSPIWEPWYMHSIRFSSFLAYLSPPHDTGYDTARGRRVVPRKRPLEVTVIVRQAARKEVSHIVYPCREVCLFAMHHNASIYTCLIEYNCEEYRNWSYGWHTPRSSEVSGARWFLHIQSDLVSVLHSVNLPQS
jgi:hypothetical protein